MILKRQKLLIKLIKEPKKQIEFGEQLFVNIQKIYSKTLIQKSFLSFITTYNQNLLIKFFKVQPSLFKKKNKTANLSLLI